MSLAMNHNYRDIFVRDKANLVFPLEKLNQLIFPRNWSGLKSTIKHQPIVNPGAARIYLCWTPCPTFLWKRWEIHSVSWNTIANSRTWTWWDWSLCPKIFPWICFGIFQPGIAPKCDGSQSRPRVFCVVFWDHSQDFLPSSIFQRRV